MKGEPAGEPSLLLVLFAKETRELLRDRRAVVFAFILPLVLFPVVFWGMTRLARGQREDIASRTLHVGVSGDDRSLRAEIEPEDAIDLVAAECRPEAVRDGRLDACVEIAPAPADEPADAATIGVRIHYVAASPASNEARRRLEAIAERWHRRALEERFASRGVPIEIDSLVALDSVDVSTNEDRSAASLGRGLPFLLLFLLLTGGSFAALDLVAGEKERGTLETLAVQPLSRRHVALGKFLVVLVASIGAVLLNLGGLAVAFVFGLVPESAGGAVPLARIAGAAALLVPQAVMTSALLLGLSARAHSFREAQIYLLPLTLILLVPCAVVLAPDVRLGAGLALVPIAGIALAIREVLADRLELLPAALAAIASAGYAWAALRWSAALLEREDIILKLDWPASPSEAAARRRENRTLVFGGVMILAVYGSSSWLQTGEHMSVAAGLALTLWGVVLLPAIGWAFAGGRRPADVLALRRPRARDCLWALPLGAALAVVLVAYLQLQDVFLPMPESLRSESERLEATLRLGPLVEVALLCISPGICEELLWRGAFQSGLDDRGRTLRTVLIVGCFFALFHLSLHRFATTFAAGAALAYVRLRSRSIFPGMILHATFNATVLFALPAVASDEELSRGLLPWLVLAAAVAVLGFGFRQIAAGGARRTE